MSSRYEALIEEAKKEIRERRERKAARFECMRCRTHFDTSAGRARHLALDCRPFPPAESVPTMSRCSACGSYAGRRDEAGEIICDTCQEWEA